MTEIVPTSSRLQAIRARVSEIEHRTGAGAGHGGARLGFGLALQNAMIEEGTATEATSPAGPQASAVGIANAAFATPAAELRPADPHAHGPLEPPAELAAYGNGLVPPEALTPVGQTGHILHGPAAEALSVLMADAASAGVTIGITDSYRSLAAQHDVADRKGIYGQGGLAAVPGTSNHGWGLSTDLDLDGPALAWMRENAWRYGFVEDVPREPWHWTFRPA